MTVKACCGKSKSLLLDTVLYLEDLQQSRQVTLKVKVVAVVVMLLSFHIQCESKKSPLKFSDSFSQTVGNF